MKKTTAIVTGTVVTKLELIKSEIDKLKHIAESVYKTSGNISGFSNLQSETSKEKLIQMFSVVMAKENYYNKAADKLGITTYPVFKLEGSTVADWEADIKLRIAIIDQKTTLDELNELRKGYEELMDKDDKIALLEKKQANILKRLRGE